MTRDEAHTATCKAWVCNSLTGEAHITTHGLLDLFIELGMLKLDEPKSVDADLREAITNAIIDNMPSLSGIRSAVEAILNIIEE